MPSPVQNSERKAATLNVKERETTSLMPGAKITKQEVTGVKSSKSGWVIVVPKPAVT